VFKLFFFFFFFLSKISVVVVVVLECGRKLVINHFVQESWVGAPTLLQEETELMCGGEHKHALTKILKKRKEIVVDVSACSS
jgi:hypothetical protein